MRKQALPQLSESDEATAQRWEGLDEAELNAEVELYRTGLRETRDSLKALGISPDWEVDHSQSAALRQDKNSNEAGEEDDAEHRCSSACAKSVSLPAQRPGKQVRSTCRLGSVDDLHPSEWQVPPHCVPIHANVTTYDWRPLAQATQFDVVMMDPPWQLATANPTRGVALGYSQLTDQDIVNLPVPSLQTNGFLFVWVINAKYKFTLDLFDKWGYKYVSVSHDAACAHHVFWN